jgi:hypothetical protein
VQLTKQVTGGLFPSGYLNPSALHGNLGFQRKIAPDFVVSVDFVYWHSRHLPVQGVSGVNLNHFNSVRGPVISQCLTAAQANDPQALCSRGSINVQQNPGRATYKGLLLRADKRFSHGFQLLGSWAYSSNTGTNAGNGLNLDNLVENYGPLVSRDFTHIVNFAGVVRLPWRFQLGLNFSYSSAPPFSAFIGGIDFDGDGTTGDPLPGSTVGAFNRGMGRVDLERLLAQFNQNYADTRDAKNAAIPKLTMPARYWLGDNFHSLDLRLSRSFVLREGWRLSLIGEVFNLYNVANLSGFSGDLTSPAFGQPAAGLPRCLGRAARERFNWL